MVAGPGKRVCLLVLSALLFLSAGNAWSYFADTRQKRVLILHSYYRGYKWTDEEHGGIEAALKPVISSTNIYTEYMDTKKAYGDLYSQRLYEVYKIKYANFRFDVIIATDNNAFDFLRQYRDRLFPGVPVVFCGVNYLRTEDLHGHPMFTGVNEEADLRGCVDLILRLHRDTKEIVFINEWTTTGRRVHDEFLRVADTLSGVRFVLLEDVAMEAILDKVGSLSTGSVVLYAAFSRDNTGRIFEYDESISLVARASRVPIYSCWDFNLGYGIVGGLMTRAHDQGEAAGRMALRILQGERAEDIPVMMTSPKHYMFDYRKLREFKIPSTDLPAGSMVINTPQSLYYRYRDWIAVTALVFLLLLAVISVLLLNISKRRRTEKELKASQAQLRTLAWRLSETEETERKSFARELHDQIGQNLTLLGVNLNLLRSLAPKDAIELTRSRITDSLSIVKQTTEKVRDLMNELRSPVLDDYGLVAAIEQYGNQFTARTGITVTVRGTEPDPRLPSHVENAMFRIVQEALTNVVKHAQATEVVVAIVTTDGKMTLSVEDNGIGYDPDHIGRGAAPKGWGLITMSERALAVAGTCRVQSGPGFGTHVIVEVPL